MQNHWRDSEAERIRGYEARFRSSTEGIACYTHLSKARCCQKLSIDDQSEAWQKSMKILIRVLALAGTIRLSVWNYCAVQAVAWEVRDAVQVDRQWHSSRIHSDNLLPFSLSFSFSFSLILLQVDDAVRQQPNQPNLEARLLILKMNCRRVFRKRVYTWAKKQFHVSVHTYIRKCVHMYFHNYVY